MWLQWLFLIDPSLSTATAITWAVSNKHAIPLVKKSVPWLWLVSFNSTSQDNVLGNVSEGNVGSNIPSEWASTESPDLFKIISWNIFGEIFFADIVIRVQNADGSIDTDNHKTITTLCICQPALWLIGATFFSSTRTGVGVIFEQHHRRIKMWDRTNVCYKKPEQSLVTVTTAESVNRYGIGDLGIKGGEHQWLTINVHMLFLCHQEKSINTMQQ